MDKMALFTASRPGRTLFITAASDKIDLIGELVAEAFRRCTAGAEIVGGRAIVVRSIDVEAAAHTGHGRMPPA
jgi:hypothetical protein